MFICQRDNITNAKDGDYTCAVCTNCKNVEKLPKAMCDIFPEYAADCGICAYKDACELEAAHKDQLKNIEEQ